MAFQISVGGTSLDLGTNARRIFGQPVNMRSTAGTHVIRTIFHIQAATPAALQAAWDTAKTTFTTKNARVILNYDDGAGTALEDLTQGKNGITHIMTSVSQVEGSASTAYSIEAVLDVVATFELTDGLTGQIGDISTTKFFTAGLVEARTVTAAFRASDDGATTGLAQYTSARSTILTTYLGVDADGGRNSSTGLALTGENIQSMDENDVVVLVTLSSEEVVVNFSSESALRASTMTIQTSQPDTWSESPEAGDIPTIITASGIATVDKDALSGSLHDVWDKIRSNVESEVISQTGLGDATLVSLSIASNRKASALTFTAIYRSDNTTTFNYRRVDTESENPKFQITVDAIGEEIVQKRPGKNPLFRTITINRTGVGVVDLTPTFGGVDFNLARTEADTYILVGTDNGLEGAVTQGDIPGVYIQQGTFVFRRVNFKPGGTVDVVLVGV